MENTHRGRWVLKGTSIEIGLTDGNVKDFGIKWKFKQHLAKKKINAVMAVCYSWNFINYEFKTSNASII